MYRDGKQDSNFFPLVHPLLGRLKFNELIRIKINCYPRKEKHYQHGFHFDHPAETTDVSTYKIAIYSVNTNNGYTIFKNGDKIESKENRMVFFDGSLEHASVTQTDENLRININITYI